MRFGYWMPIFGGWLRNVADEGMPVAWPYLRDLAAQSEQHGFDLSLIAELNLNDIKGHRAPSLDCWTLAPAVAAVTSTLELMLAVRPNYHSPSLTAKALSTLDVDRARPDLAQRRLVLVEGRGGAVRRAVRRARRAVRAYPGVAGGPRPAADRGDRDPRRRRCTSSTARCSSRSPARVPPVYMGGESPKAKEVIAAQADAYVMHGDAPEVIAAKVAELTERRRRRAGRR